MNTPQLSRRTALKAGAGALGAGVLGAASFAGSATAQMSSPFSANPVTVASDTGDVDEVHLAPESTIEWHNFDVPITKVRQLLLGRMLDADGNILTGGWDGVGESAQNGLHDAGLVSTGEGIWPIWRETPWMFTHPVSEPADFYYNASGGAGSPANFTDASYMSAFDVDGFPNQKEEATSGMFTYDLMPSDTPSDREDNGETKVYVSREGHPRPDYQTWASNNGGATYESLLTGTSIAGGGNFHNGSYGTLGDTSLLDNAEDGTTKDVEVELWLLTTLHTDYDFAENPSRDPANQEDRFSPLAMARSGDGGIPVFADEAAQTYRELIVNADAHPAVDLTSATFTVSAVNEPSETGSTTTANTGGS